MDNFTHSLIGLAFGEVFYQFAKKKTSQPRSLFYCTSILANNFPDIDLVYSLFDSTSLGYLVHHRGYTHTFVWLVPQFFLLSLLTSLYQKITKNYVSQKQNLLLYLTSLIGLTLHIGMDAFNVYGVHPLHPFNENWFYGDRIFIIEPLIWSALLPLFLVSVKTKWKYLILAAPVLLMTLGFALKALTIYSLALVFLTFFGLLFFLLKIDFKNNSLSSKSLPKFLDKPFVSLYAFLLVLCVFLVAGGTVKNQILKQTKDHQLNDLYDIALSPAPANPFCWVFLLADGNSVDYRIHKGIYNLIPFIKCPSFFSRKTYQLSNTIEMPINSSNITFTGFLRATKQSLTEDIESNCRLKAWFQFTRIPFKLSTLKLNADLGKKNGKNKVQNDIYFDARFLRDRNEKSFATFETGEEKKHECPPYPAPWNAPFKGLKTVEK